MDKNVAGVQSLALTLSTVIGIFSR